MTADIPGLERDELGLEELELEQLLRDADDLPRLPAGLKRRTLSRAARHRAADRWMQHALSAASAVMLLLGLLLSAADPSGLRDGWVADVPFPPDVIRTRAGLREDSAARISPELEWALVEDSHRLREYQRGVIHGVF